MYPKHFFRTGFGIGLVCLVLASSAFAQSKDLDRNFEPVVINGGVFPEFVGAAITAQANELFLYAYRADSKSWEQIPFQFDEKNSAGKYFNPNVDEVAGLDDNDELAFMAKDAGDRGNGSWIDDDGSRSTVRYEIKLTDPLSGKTGWVYLYRSRTITFSPNLLDYIQYFESTTSSLGADKISSLFYELANAPNGFPQDLVIPTSAGGSGVDLLDRLKFRARATLVLSVNIDEDDIQFQAGRSDSVRFKDGRIRVIRELEATLRVDLPFPLSDRNVDFSTPPIFYYPYSANVFIAIPDGLGDASISSGRMSFDLNVSAVGMKFVSANNPEPGFTVDGLANETPNKTVDNVLPSGNWVYVNGSQGTVVHRFPLATTVGGKRELYFKDSSANDSGDTGDKRSYGDAGINITDGISPPFTLSYQGYFLGKEQGSSVAAQIALNEQNPLQLDFAPQDFGSVPVELVTFNATVDEQSVQLEWLTATETNNFGFDVERRYSEDSDWERRTFVEGRGTTTEPSRYVFVDRNLQAGAYDYRLKQIDTDGAFEYSSVVSATVGLPTTFMLAQNFPNPFNPTTEIQYQLAAAENSGGTRTLLKIYNILGKEVRTLVDEEQAPGFYRISWDGRDDFGQRLASGIYIYRLQSGKFVATRKMALVQ